MEKYQDYIIHVIPSKWDDFEREFHKVIDCGYWKERKDLTEKASKAYGYDRQLMCIESPDIDFKEKNIKGVLWLWLGNSSVEIFNIVPLIGNHLEFSEYNYILESFHKSIVEQLSATYSLKIEISKPFFDIADVATTESIDALKSFSESANKSTGHTHPCDFRRWCEFVISSYRAEKHIGVSDLMNWLIENGWADDMANELALDYEYSLDLLDQYEHSR